MSATRTRLPGRSRGSAWQARARSRAARAMSAFDRVDWRRVFKEQGRRLVTAAHVTPRRVRSERGSPATRATPT
jgi:hypothetical protein